MTHFFFFMLHLFLTFLMAYLAALSLLDGDRNWFLINLFFVGWNLTFALIAYGRI